MASLLAGTSPTSSGVRLSLSQSRIPQSRQEPSVAQSPEGCASQAGPHSLGWGEHRCKGTESEQLQQSTGAPLSISFLSVEDGHSQCVCVCVRVRVCLCVGVVERFITVPTKVLYTFQHLLLRFAGTAATTSLHVCDAWFSSHPYCLS